MSSAKSELPLVYLVRHGETAWTISHQHTGLTDLPLTDRGEQNARSLGQRLHGPNFARVFTSPLKRAVRTCELAGFGAVATVDPDLVEWNYGEYEGKTTAEIRQRRPDWDIFLHGCPGGESATDIGRRADRVIERLRAIDADVLIFSHSHFLRVLAARWLGEAAAAGRYYFLGTAAFSIVGYEHGKHDPVIRLWNDCHHACG